jgi:hypothetical protein
MFRTTRSWVLATISALLICGPFAAASANAEETTDEAALKSRFELLSQRGNVECSTKFEASIATMPPDARLQGSCCAPMDKTRYRQQINGLKKYSDIAEVPPDPYDISAPLAYKLMGDYDLALNKEEQAVYDYAMERSDMQGPCCCKCWRYSPIFRSTARRSVERWSRLWRAHRHKDALVATSI